MANWRVILCTTCLMGVVACGDDGTPGILPPPGDTSEARIAVSGRGVLAHRYNAEVWVHGAYAYTTTWGNRAGVPGNVLYTWDVRSATPVLVDSAQVAGVGTLGDVQASDDGSILVVPTEPGPGSIVIFSLADPARPRQVGRFVSQKITNGVHTAEVQRIDGRLYAFLSVNLSSSFPSRLMVVDITDPASPTELWTRDMGQPFIHDVFVRDGILFTALWDGGLAMWDIGGGTRGGSLASPVQISSILTRNGNVHNAWWFHDPVTGSKRYLFVGEEGPSSLLSSSSGDIHVVDVSDFAAPREVAYFSVPGAGTHNFSMDEARGILYAAYYNGGVQALDVRGDLGNCTDVQRGADGLCDLRRMDRLLATGLLDRGTNVYVWGVHFTGDALYASDMLNGLWKLGAVTR